MIDAQALHYGVHGSFTPVQKYSVQNSFHRGHMAFAKAVLVPGLRITHWSKPCWRLMWLSPEPPIGWVQDFLDDWIQLDVFQSSEPNQPMIERILFNKLFCQYHNIKAAPAARYVQLLCQKQNQSSRGKLVARFAPEFFSYSRGKQHLYSLHSKSNEKYFDIDGYSRVHNRRHLSH